MIIDAKMRIGEVGIEGLREESLPFDFLNTCFMWQTRLTLHHCDSRLNHCPLSTGGYRTLPLSLSDSSLRLSFSNWITLFLSPLSDAFMASCRFAIHSLHICTMTDRQLTLVVVGVDGGGVVVGDGRLRDGRAEEAQQDELSTHCGDAVFLKRIGRQATRSVRPISAE